MKTNPSKLGTALAGVLALTALSARVHANAIAYTVTDLGTLGGTTSEARGINASGQVVGYANPAGDVANHAVVWNGTTPTDLGVGVASGINDSGQTAGGSPAVRWTGTTPTVLGSPPGSTATHGLGINTSGQVAGWAKFSLAEYQAVRWTGTIPEVLGSLGSNKSWGYGINDSGQVVGTSYLANNGGHHAVIWNGTTPTDLGTLGGTGSEARGINATGQIAGWAQITDNSATHAVVWDGATPTDLGTLGGTGSLGFGINDSGQVVGESQIPGDTTFHAFLYTDGVMYDLFTLLILGSGVTDLGVSEGKSINNLGQIAAYGTINGEQHALRLDPVATPEPSSLALLAVAAIGLASRRNRKTL